MWIRSQYNTELIDCNHFFVINRSERTYSIYARKDGTCALLGDYSTKEKALCVLDDIQTFISDTKNCKNGVGNNGSNKDGVYIMPTDDNVKATYYTMVRTGQIR